MKKRMISLFLLTALLLCLLPACADENDVLTGAEAQAAVLEAAGLDAGDVSNVHNHFEIVDGVPQYEIHLTYGGKDYTYVVHGRTGEIISSHEGGH